MNSRFDQMRKVALYSMCMSILPVYAGVDQPWNEPNDGGGPISLAAIVFAIAYFFAIFRWPKASILLVAAMLVGGTVAKWFGEALGWTCGAAFAIWAYRLLRNGKVPSAATPTLHSEAVTGSSAQEELLVAAGDESEVPHVRRLEENSRAMELADCINTRNHEEVSSKNFDEKCCPPCAGPRRAVMSTLLNCPNCLQKLKVPADKLLDVTCPKCRHVFRKFT